MKKLSFAILIFLFAAIFFAEDFSEPIYSVKSAARPFDESKIDIDFSKMNFNIASGVVFDMMVSPQKYDGKAVKITGLLSSEIYDGKRTFAVFVWDATGCCPTGLTVVPLEGKKYPADFPKERSLVTVSGTMQTLGVFGGESLCLVAQKWE